MKGARNGLLEAILATFMWKKGEQRPSWSHIEKLYQLDSPEQDFKMCPKLTDGHIYASKMKKMKVNIAAQVFSQSVSSILRRLVEFGK